MLTEIFSVETAIYLIQPAFARIYSQCVTCLIDRLVSIWASLIQTLFIPRDQLELSTRAVLSLLLRRELRTLSEVRETLLYMCPCLFALRRCDYELCSARENDVARLLLPGDGHSRSETSLTSIGNLCSFAFLEMRFVMLPSNVARRTSYFVCLILYKELELKRKLCRKYFFQVLCKLAVQMTAN